MDSGTFLFDKLENFWAINFSQQRRDKIENEKFNSSALSVSDVNKFQIKIKILKLNSFGDSLFFRRFFLLVFGVCVYLFV